MQKYNKPHSKVNNKPKRSLSTQRKSKHSSKLHQSCQFSTISTPSTTETVTVTSTKKTKKNKSPYKKFVSNPSRQVLSGIQPTGVVHIGNLFGAVSNWVSLQYTEPILRQNTFLSTLSTQRSQLLSGELQAIPSHHPLQHKPVLFTVVDLHAITVPRPANELEDAVKTLTATLLGSGIEPERAKLFVQSHVTQHTELAWLLTCNTPVSWLYRMTQFKDKSQKLEKQSQNGETNTNVVENEEVPLSQLPRGVMAGLLQYPALMAADILLYNATHVPVGDDQTQHLEFARELARTMNSSFSPIFVEPSHIYNPFATRVMSLRSPENKMSKSDPSEAGKITLTDTDDEISKKIKSAVTDAFGGVSYDNAQRPGLSNLLNIYAASENMKIMMKHNKKIDDELKETFFYKNDMLSLDSLSTGPNSRKLYDYAMSSLKPIEGINQVDQVSQVGQFKLQSDDGFEQAYQQYLNIVNQQPPLVSPELLADQHKDDKLAVFKPAVADSLIELLAPIRNKTNDILKNDEQFMKDVVKDGADSAREIAIQTVNRTKDVMGMRF